MKSKLLTLTLAVLTVGLLGSCSKINERIDGLDKRVYDLENNQIASIEQQITAINTSINELKAADVTINGKIADLKTAADAQQALIDALQEADRALGQKDAALEARIATLEGQVTTINGQIDALVNADIAINTRIDQLQSYVDTEIGKAKDWATATFASLTEYEKTAEDLAALSVTVTGISTTLAEVQTSISGLDAKIDGIDVALQGKITTAKTELEGEISDLKTELEGEIAEAIATSEAGLKSWVNEQLSAYYTAAQMDAKIDGLQNQLDDLKTDTDANKSKIEELETKLAQLEEALEEAKTTIKAEYKAAIDEAIKEYDGIINQTIQTKIDEVNATIIALTVRVDDLETAVGLLTGRIDAIEAMIQSVSITPAYSDGSVEAVDGILTLKCIVSPAEALIGMESLKDSLLIYADSVKVKTKATTPAYMTIEVSGASVLDAAQGAITLTADISEYLPKGEDKALTVAVNIKNGISHFTTEFVPVYVAPGPVLPAGALKGAFTVSDDGAGNVKKVYFSKGNLYWDGDSFELETNQYDVQSSWSTSHVSHFFWSKTESVAYAESYSDAGAAADDVFFTNATAETAKSDFTVNGVTGKYRTLSTAEWQYLINKNGDENIRKGKYKYGVTVCDKTNCLILAPDDFEGTIAASYDAAAWATAEAAGLVCLPAAGGRYDSDVIDAGGYGNYWSSTAYSEYLVYSVIFYSYIVYPGNAGNRDGGCSVRLVTEGGSPAPSVVPVTGVTLNKTELSLMEGKSETLVATVQPENATNKNVIWSSDNTGVATVGSTDGKVTAITEGTATVTAIVDGLYTATCTVTVKALPADLSQIINSALSGKSRGETATVTLSSSKRYTLATAVDAGLVNIVVNGNGAIVNVSADAQITGMQGIEINNVNFDCAEATVAPIALSANPDESLKGSTIQTEGTSLRGNAFYNLETIKLNNCNFSGVKTSLVSANKREWNLKNLTIKNCIVQFDVASGIESYINWYGNSKNEGSIKDIVIEGSTLYNIVKSNENYFLRYANKSNAEAQKVWPTPQFDGQSSWTMKNNTFVNLPSNKDFANNYPNKNPLHLFTWTGNIFYNTTLLTKAIQGNVVTFTAADNSIKGITKTVDATDASKFATVDEDLALTVPTAALDLTNLDLKANFTPTKDSYSCTNGFGDPRWRLTGVTVHGRNY